MLDNKVAYLTPKFTTVWPVLNLFGIFSAAVLKEEGEHHYLSLCAFHYVLEIHFVGKRFERAIRNLNDNKAD